MTNTAEQQYLLTVHEGDKERTLCFPSLEARQAYVDKLKQQPDVDVGPLIGDDKFADYMERRNKTLAQNGIFIDVYDNTMKFSLSEEAHERLSVEAHAQGIDLQTHLQRQLDEYAADISRLRKTGRNDPCFCGSGKKFKKCCGSRHDS